MSRYESGFGTVSVSDSDPGVIAAALAPELWALLQVLTSGESDEKCWDWPAQHDNILFHIFLIKSSVHHGQAIISVSLCIRLPSLKVVGVGR